MQLGKFFKRCLDLENEVTEKLWKIASRVPFPSPYFLQPSRVKKLNIPELFPEFKKYFLELGSGWGEVALELAEKNPSVLYLLLEKKIDRIKKTIRNSEKKDLKNIKIITVNFNWFLNEFLSENQFDEILLNFPDPWPKSRHHKHRTFDSVFAEKLSFLLKEGGRFRFASDHGGYARQVIRNLRKSIHFSPPQIKFQRDDIPVSFFESEKRKEGKRIYFLETIKDCNLKT